MDKEERIKREYERLMEIFQDVDGNIKATAQGLIQEAAFMSVLLEDLRANINKNGTVDEYKNGEHQYGYKESADLRSYNSTMKNYKAVMDKLLKITPYAKPKKAADPWELKRIENEHRQKEFIEAARILDEISANSSQSELEQIKQCRIDAGADIMGTLKIMKERGLIKDKSKDIG